MISVIIPCYNAERYLAACAQSVLRQDVELELLLVDDGSTDGTAALLRRIAASDVRVRALYMPQNGGVSRARNRALEAARGEWVTFVDADDLLPDGALRRLLAAAGPGVELVIGAHEELREDGARVRVRPEAFIRGRDPARDRDAVTRRLIEGDAVYNIMCGKLHSRAMLERAHIRLDEGVRIGEDALFNLRAVRAAQRLAYVDEPVYVYRMHAASAMHSVREGEFARHRPFFEALRRELSAEGSRLFGALAASMALRLYKEGGLAAVLSRFNAEARPVLRAQEARGVAAALVRAGVYPALYAAAFPLWRVWRKAMAEWRCARARQY